MNIGKSVHYVSYGSSGDEFPSSCRAAIITEEGIDGDVTTASTLKLGVAVLNPSGLFFNRNLPYVPIPKLGHPTPGSWHWIEEHEEGTE